MKVLQLMFRQAASRHRDLRTEITDALEELPNLLECTGILNGIWSDSLELHQCSSDLYVSILKTLHHIVYWMKQKSPSKQSHILL